MLTTRPFTNQEVADRLRALRDAGCFQREYEGLIAEACRRLRGWLPSGAENHNDLIIKMGEALMQVCGDDSRYDLKAHEACAAYGDWLEQFYPTK